MHNPSTYVRLMAIMVLVVIGIMVFLRPFIPTLPFKVGNYVKAGDLLGKVEAISFLNTRMKTFFVSNRQILNEIVINYHLTQTRRVKIDLSIRYDQDLLKAKQTLEMIMIEDPRVKFKPKPIVYLMKLAASSVDLGEVLLGGQQKLWVTRCDLMEKAKLRFDRKGIQFAFPQLDLHIEPNKLQISKIGQSTGKAQPVLSGHHAGDEEKI